MKKSIFLFFAAILCAMSVNAKTLYLNPGLWNVDGAWFAAYFFDNGETWAKCTDTDSDGIYEVEAPDGYPKVIFVRKNPANSELNWSDKYNQTGNIDIPTDGRNLFTITAWDDQTTGWSTYDPLAINVYLAGTMNGWNATADQFKLPEAGASVAELTKTIEQNAEGELKIVVGGSWKTNTTGSITRENAETGLVVDEENTKNIPFNADMSGEYTFKWNISEKKLTVVYPTEVVEITHTYTVAGSESVFGTNWDPKDTTNDMEEQDDGTYKLEKTNVLLEANNSIEFKVCVDHDWTSSYPTANYKYDISETGYYSVVVTFSPANEEVKVIVTKTADAEAPTHTYTVAGSAALCGVEWDYTATDNDMTTEDNITYTWTKTGIEVSGTLKFKIFEDHSNSQAYPENDWEIKPENYGGNGVYTVTITFKADTKEVVVAMENTGKIDATYYITGTLPDITWTPDETALTDNGDNTYKFSCTLVAEQSYEFKITTGKWASDGGTEYTAMDKIYKGVSGGNGSNVTMKLASETEVTIIFNAITGKISFDGLEESTFTVAGSAAAFGTDWDATDWENEMKLQDDGTYVWSRGGLYLTENVEFKVVKDYNFDNGAWPSANWVLKIGQDQDNKPGYYKLTIYYNPSNNDITVIATPQEIQKISLTFDNLQIEEVDYEGTTVLNLSASIGTGWMASTTVTIYLNNYTGENKEYDVMSESSVMYENNGSVFGSVSGKLTQSYASELHSFTGTVNAVLEVYTYNEETEEETAERFPYQITLTLKEPTPVPVEITNATVSLNDGEGALKLTSTFTFEDESYPTFVKLTGFESLVANKTYNHPQCGEIQMGGDDDNDPWLDFAVANTIDVSYNENTIQLKGKFKSWNTGTAYSVTISGTIPTIQLGGGNNSTVISNNIDKLVMVEMDRTFTTEDGYYTICVPFNIAAYELGTVHTITSVTKAAAEGFNVNFSEVETIEAGYPYLLEPSVNLTNPKFVVNLKNATAQTSSASGQGLSVSMTGVLTTTDTETTDGLYWVGNSGYLYNDDVTKLSLRSYFTITSASGIAPRMRVVTGENATTDVEDIVLPEGQAVKAIVNGQLIIIREGVKYNVQGQKL